MAKQKKSALSEEQIKRRISEATATVRAGLPLVETTIIVSGEMKVTSPQPGVKIVKREGE